MSFTWVDWSIIALIAISGLISLTRGFVREALSLFGWLGASVVAWLYGGALAGHLAPYIELPSARVIAAGAILFVVTLMIGALVTHLFGLLVQATGLTGTDRLLGMVFGVARGVLLVVIVVGLLSLAPVQQDPWWQQSALLPEFLMIADWSKDLVLGLFQQSSSAVGLPGRAAFPL
ncbi:membrane protein required for colicin V production [Pseudomonas sp. OF001]|uniref:CvpA family protein n=1 Tax=unclassified Pseudomonas TaxID=196821 RepID=UPI0010A62443|nr:MULTISPECIES: CvpA family protein [unclassified Pseudomonas]THG85263.1 CvpA family protein [Pseudomonas sp. A-1]WPP47504.1 CvpA family protein [Pseudomonas sp. AN-1]CAD5376511.1 membrane protein required for colicin V production [Pseudomonas sp. OF001]